MTADQLTVGDVLNVINSGEVIKEYRDDKPFPSRLILAFVSKRPVHVVAALDAATGLTYLVTAYVCDPALWEDDFRRRKR